MQVYYTAIVTIIVLLLNLRVSINMGISDAGLIIMEVLQSFLLGMYIGIALGIRGKR